MLRCCFYPPNFGGGRSKNRCQALQRVLHKTNSDGALSPKWQVSRRRDMSRHLGGPGISALSGRQAANIRQIFRGSQAAPITDQLFYLPFNHPIMIMVDISWEANVWVIARVSMRVRPGPMICICMAASYLAVYYLETTPRSAHRPTPQLYAYIHACRRQVGSSFL
jgi:hypothetical protein